MFTCSSISIKLRCPAEFILIKQPRRVLFISFDLYLAYRYLVFFFFLSIGRLGSRAFRCPFDSKILGFMRYNANDFSEFLSD